MHGDARAAIRNRYSFNNPASAAIDGLSIIEDLVGPHDGVVRGASGVFTGTEIVLPGGTHAGSGAYVDLPNGMISSIESDATFEAWYTINSTADDWGRIFDFGENQNLGEVLGPGAISGPAGDSFFYSPIRDTDPNRQRIAMENDGSASAHVPPIPGVVNSNAILLNSSVPQLLGAEQHVVITYIRDSGIPGPETLPAITMYLNGVHAGTVVPGASAPHQLVNLNDVNNWLGRSNYAADNILNGSINEFRIYDHAFSAQQALESYQRGPGEVPEPVTLASLLSGLVAASVCAGRRRR
jgi:hypothetical protein